MKLKLRQLDGFVAITRRGSFSAAARELGMTQPALSQLIRHLEAELGSLLFERTTRRVDLTDAGRRFLTLIQRPLEDLGDAHHVMRNLADTRHSRIAFASLPSVACAVAIPRLAAFKAAYPRTQVRLFEAQNRDIVEKVLNREVDFGIGTLSTRHPGLEFRTLMIDELVPVFPDNHPYARRRTVSWVEFAREPLVLLTGGSSVRAIVEQHLAAAGLAVEPAYEVAGMSTALALIRAGLGVTARPRIALERIMMTGLASTRFPAPRPRRRIGIITRKGHALPDAAQEYADLLFRAARNFPQK